MRNTQFHFIVVGVIIATITAFFIVTGKLSFNGEPAPTDEPVAQPQEDKGDKIIAIWEASWGLNCLTAIDNERKDMQSKSRQDWNDMTKMQPEVPLPELPKLNNGLAAVSYHCNGEVSCEFIANDAFFGMLASRRCTKELNIVYRCYSYDKRRVVKASQGNTVALTCAEENAAQ